MPLISASGLTRYFGGDDIFRNVGFTLEPGQRVGLVGPNGAGKSTMLRLIIGEDEPNHGQIDYQTGLKIGYQPQTPPEPPEGSLWASVEAVFDDLHALEKKLDDLSHRMGEPDCPESVMNSYSDLQHDFEIRGGYTWRNKVETVLDGLGFRPGDYDRPVSEFSGGWRTRASLARLLLAEPDVLVLDEPTNHLDLDSVKWLETFLCGYRGTLLIVSHDRFFLDRVCTDTWELDFRTLEVYPGNYSKYVKLRTARYAERLKQYEAQQVYIADTEDFIRRNIAGQRSQEAKGRRKKLERFLETEAITVPPIHRVLHCRFLPIPRSGDRVIRVTGMKVGYSDDAVLATIPKFEMERGQRIAVLGANGTGKSTFLKSIVGEIKPLAGTVELGANVKVAYFSQTHEDLDLDMDLLDTLRRAWPGGASEQKVRDLLGGLLFSGDDVFKKVGVLSGGQRSRVALAKLAVSGANLLILDEPSNHLDIPTQEALQELLQSFTGTMILVSHDRYLVDALDPEVVVLADNTMKELHGGWRAYAGIAEKTPEGASPKARAAASEQKAAEAKAATPVAKSGGGSGGGAGSLKKTQDLDLRGAGNSKGKGPAQTKPSGNTKKAAPPLSYEEQKRQRNELKRLQSAFDKTEVDIAALEDEKRMLEHALGRAGQQKDMNTVQRLGLEHAALEKKLEILMARWAELAEHLDRAAE